MSGLTRYRIISVLTIKRIVANTVKNFINVISTVDQIVPSIAFDQVQAIAIIQRIIPIAALQVIPTSPAFKVVRSSMTANRIIPGKPVDDITAGRSVQKVIYA